MRSADAESSDKAFSRQMRESARPRRNAAGPSDASRLSARYADSVGIDVSGLPPVWAGLE